MSDRAQTFTMDEVKRLLRVTAEHRRGWRDHVIIALALATGLREFEIASLDFGDLFRAGCSDPRQRVGLRVYKTSNTIKEQQVVSLSSRIRAKLAEHRRWMARQGYEVGPTDPVFVSNQAKRISTRMIRHMFSSWQERAGIDRPLTFHALRHTACTMLWKSTSDIRLVQAFARHADIRSTTRYTHPTADDIDDAVKSLPC